MFDRASAEPNSRNVSNVPTSQPPWQETAVPDQPSVLGKYQLLEELGHGAVGVVHRARDHLMDKEVAVKVFAPTSTAQREIYN